MRTSLFERLLVMAGMVGALGCAADQGDGTSSKPPETFQASAQFPKSDVSSTSREQALGAAVAHFLTEWLANNRADSAAARYVSQRLDDERFVPRQWYSPAEYAAKFSGPRIAQFRQMPSDQVHQRLAVHLEYVRRGLGTESTVPDTSLTALATGNVQKSDAELWEFLRPHKPRALPQVAALAYTVRQWEDVSWIAPSTAAYRAAMEDRFRAEGLEGQAVLARFQRPTLETPVPLLFMLWVDESKTGSDWKLWGVEPESVH